MTTTQHGPGVTWLADRAGTTPEALLHNGTALATALEGAGRDAVDLARRLMSDDPAVRTRAEAEARALRTHFATAPDGTTASGEPTPGERFRARVAEALSKAAPPP